MLEAFLDFRTRYHLLQQLVSELLSEIALSSSFSNICLVRKFIVTSSDGSVF